MAEKRHMGNIPENSCSIGKYWEELVGDFQGKRNYRGGGVIPFIRELCMHEYIYVLRSQAGMGKLWESLEVLGRLEFLACLHVEFALVEGKLYLAR